MNQRNITPSEAVSLFLADKETDDLATRTIETYRSQLSRFVEWLQGRESRTETIRDVDGLTLKAYKRAHSDHANSTLHNTLRTVREMLRWAASVNAHDRETVEAIELTRPQDVRNSEVSAEEARAILDRLERYQYASRDHVQMLLLWTTGCRVGALHSFDVSDHDREQQSITAEHRPPETTLKNGAGGERVIALDPTVSQTIADYVDHNRIDVEGDSGREPLLTTEHGRPTRNTLRYALYALTRPCWRGDDCPDGLDPADCDAAQTVYASNDCPHNNSPHDVRRGRLTAYRRDDVPKHVISDRCDVSVGVLEEHYNTMSAEEKMEQRRDYL